VKRTAVSQPPLVVHIIYRLAVGGLENGLVNLINRMSPERYRHAIICLTDYTDFRFRISQPDVAIYALHKSAGKDIGLYYRLWKLLRTLRPDILHTRNLSGLEAQLPGFLAGVRYRIHSEHGREGANLDGNYTKHNLLRRAFSPLVHKYIALSSDLENWLRVKIKIPTGKLVQIINGVDIERFRPADKERALLPIPDFAPQDTIVIGTIGRMAVVKDQLTLVKSFIELLRRDPDASKKLRLVIVGEGVLRQEAIDLLEKAEASRFAWLPGSRDDVPEILRALDIFVLPSLNEGISNTILEAMATGLPVVATNVGGNSELIVDGVTGSLVPRSDFVAMADTLDEYLSNPDLVTRRGQAGRSKVMKDFTMEKMVLRYTDIYDDLRSVRE